MKDLYNIVDIYDTQKNCCEYEDIMIISENIG